MDGEKDAIVHRWTSNNALSDDWSGITILLSRNFPSISLIWDKKQKISVY
jgi:hypothetical protein